MFSISKLELSDKIILPLSHKNIVYQVDSGQCQVRQSMPLYGSSSGENSKYREMLISGWMVDGVSLVLVPGLAQPWGQVLHIGSAWS